MKPFVLSLLITAVLAAQGARPGEITPDTVVANVGGRDVTAGEIQKSMRNWNQTQMQRFHNNPPAVLQEMFTLKYWAAEGEKRNLGNEEPWKSQIEYAREGIMYVAEVNFERNTFPVSEQDAETYYAANKAKFEQSKIKVIKIGLREPIPVASKENLSKIAALTVQNEHAPNRSEDAAKTIAAEVVKQARAGADFAALAKEYSDDEESKAAGGDYGNVSPSSSYPEEMKKAVLALKPGEVSEPVRQTNALYVIRVESREAPPIDQVRSAIIDSIRDEHLKAMGTEVRDKFAAKILRPEFFLSSGDAPQAKKP